MIRFPYIIKICTFYVFNTCIEIFLKILYLDMLGFLACSFRNKTAISFCLHFLLNYYGVRFKVHKFVQSFKQLTLRRYCYVQVLIFVFSIQLENIEKGLAEMNTSVAVEMVSDLNKAVNKTFPLYGNDILVFSLLLNRIVEHEKLKTGLDLSHRQDRDFIKVRQHF